MPYYAAFGGCLRSEVPLPELREIEGVTPDWTVRIADRNPVEGRLLGEEPVENGVHVRVSRLPDGVRLAFDDTGAFDVSARGSDIAWSAGPDPRPELVRADLLGAVFSVALHQQGLICLHGSGVTIDGVALGFLAHKGTGKSTTAMALCAAGAALVTDDMLPVHPGPPPVVWPAMPAVRLLDDSAVRFRAGASATRDDKSGKYRLTALEESRVEQRRTPLGAVYELFAVTAELSGPAVRRVRLTSTEAVAALLRHHRTGKLLGRVESLNLFTRAADIARTVPVYRLEIARDLDRLPEVAAQVIGWHRSAPSAAASVAVR